MTHVVPADGILTNARILTNRPSMPWAAELAWHGGRITHIGGPGSANGAAGPGTLTLDLEGRLVLPGLCDSHIHFTNWSLSLQEVDLFEVPALAAMLDRLRKAATDLHEGGWLLGRGWNQAIWPEGRFPTRHDLDRVCGPHPALLYAKSGHAAVASSSALREAGLHAGTIAPEGGFVELDADNQPTGLLLENPAIRLVEQACPVPTPSAMEAACLQGQKLLHAWGVTSVHDFDGRQGFEAFQRLDRSGLLRLRTVNHVSQDQFPHALDFGLNGPVRGPWLTIGGLKLFADGALGPRTAAMAEPYAGEPDNYGMTVVDKEEMLELVALASRRGIASCIHAIGDRANRDVLDMFQEVRRQEREAGVAPDERRHRIEHAQVLLEQDMSRFAHLDINVAVQPIHATQDMAMVDQYWGERGRYAYAFKSLLSHGTRMAFGSDAPVETPNPWVGLHAAVTRQRADGTPGPDGWYPEQKVDRMSAVRAYTAEAAYLEGLEGEIGTLAPGMRADLTVPDRDVLACTPNDLLHTTALLTVAGGDIVHRATLN